MILLNCKNVKFKLFWWPELKLKSSTWVDAVQLMQVENDLKVEAASPSSVQPILSFFSGLILSAIRQLLLLPLTIPPKLFILIFSKKKFFVLSLILYICKFPVSRETKIESSGDPLIPATAWPDGAIFKVLLQQYCNVKKAKQFFDF